MQKVTCAVDYFGVAGNSIVQALLNQSSNNRARKVAFNNLVRLAKASGLIRKDEDIWYVGFEINRAGAPVIAFIGLPKEIPS
jgi:hypothetical protein